MAVKTITIDMEAYGLLSRYKREGQSFSQVIKEHFGPQPTVARFREIIRKVRISDEVLDNIEAQIQARKKNPARVFKL